MRYYLAYGSNLSSKQMKRRCPASRLIGAGYLEGYILEFQSAYGGSAFATITPDKGSQVPIAIYEVAPSDEESLDIYEGVYGKHYFRMDVEVTVNGEKIHAFAYRMNLNATLGLPSKTYVDVILEGYREFNFNTNYLRKAIIKSSTQFKPKG